jgi:BASS family bile acid:Na+ symporter
MGRLKNIILNRNFILIFSVLLGLIAGDAAHYIKEYTFYVLAIVMTFSTTGINTKAILPIKSMIKPMIIGSLLNYVVFGSVIISLAYLLMPTQDLFLGFVIIASTPAGVAVIPFSGILNGDLKYGIIGTLGVFLSSLFFAPLILNVFSGLEGGINSMDLFWIMVKLVIIPLILSRLLLYRPILPTVQKIRGKVVDFGFAIILFTAIGLNRQVFFSNFDILALVSLVLFLSVFGLGFVYSKFCKWMKFNPQIATTQNLLLTIKSSGFAVVTALSLFGEEAAIPSAILSIVILAYLLFLNMKNDLEKRKKLK